MRLLRSLPFFLALQEEIGRFKGYWWSPDSTSLLYQHTDTRPLEQFGILDLQNPGNDTDRNPYPRPGKQNATVTLGILRVPQQTDSDVADTAASKKRRLADGTAASAQTESAASSPETKWLDWDTTAYPYLCTVAWESSSAPLTLVVQNRLQTETAVLVVPDIASGACRTLLTLRDDRWVSIDHSSPRWLTDGRHFLLSSDQLTEYDTLYLYDASGKRIRPLHDSTTVMYRRLLHVDEARDVCYVLGGPNPTEQHVWRISLGLAAGSTTAGEATSITSSPAIHNAVFSADGATFVHERANLTEGTRFFVRRIASDFGATTDSTADDARAGAVLAQLRIVAAVVPPEHAPRVKLKQIIGDESIALAELAASDALVKADRDTNALTQALEELRRAAAGTETATSTETTQAATTTTSSSSHTYYAAVLRPADYSPSRRYPVICYVYGGPGHRLVTCDRSMWLVAQWMANQGYIVVTSDNRGTPCRGAAWEKAIKGDFQELPLRDQVIVLRTLAASDPSMDLSRGVGIFGWSFGGYMSALAVMRYPSLFHAAFVGAPVCDWRDYDTNYVERVLGLPTDDDSPTDPYRRSSVLTYAKQLLRPLLLVHGSADDNVYFMHAIKMSAELFAHGRPHVFLPLGGTHMLADARGHTTTGDAREQGETSLFARASPLCACTHHTSVLCAAAASFASPRSDAEHVRTIGALHASAHSHRLRQGVSRMRSHTEAMNGAGACSRQKRLVSCSCTCNWNTS